MKQALFKKLEDRYDEMVEIRRYLHANPELSFKEVKTAAYIADFYKQLGVDVKTEVGGNGVVAKIKGGKPGKTVALRADFDALPIQEETGLSFTSNIPGVMHACGHDGHTAVLLTIAKVLHEIKDELSGDYVLIHQHAEELAPGGAISMIKDGCLEGVDVIFGTHLWAEIPYGTISYRTGPFMAAADGFEINIKGRGGHGAMPHKTKDAVAIGSQLVMNLQQIVSRKVNPVEPAVVSVSSFVADNAFNVIADTAKLKGTVRTFSDDVRDFIEKEMEAVIKGTCLANGNCDYDFVYKRGYPAVVNHKNETEFLAEMAAKIPGVTNVEELEQQMGGEDFAYYLQHVKGTFFFTGAQPDGEASYPHHHPKFDIKEEAMLLAAKTLALAAVEYQKQELPQEESIAIS